MDLEREVFEKPNIPSNIVLLPERLLFEADSTGSNILSDLLLHKETFQGTG